MTSTRSASHHLQKWDFPRSIHTPRQERLFRDLALSDGNLTHLPSSPRPPPISTSSSPSTPARRTGRSSLSRPTFSEELDFSSDSVAPSTVRSSLQSLTSLHQSLTRNLSRIQHHLHLLAEAQPTSGTTVTVPSHRTTSSTPTPTEDDEEESLLTLASRHEMLRRLVVALESKLPFFYADQTSLPAILSSASSSTSPIRSFATGAATGGIGGSPPGSPSGSRSMSSLDGLAESVHSAGGAGGMGLLESDYFLRMIGRLESALSFFRRGQTSGGLVGAASYVARFERRRELIWGELRDRIVGAFSTLPSPPVLPPPSSPSSSSPSPSSSPSASSSVQDELERQNVGCRDQMRKMRKMSGSGSEGVNLKPWIQELARHAPRVYFNDVFAGYYNMRHALVVPLVQRACQDAVRSLEKNTVVMQLRGALMVLLCAVEFEKELFWEIFGLADDDGDENENEDEDRMSDAGFGSLVGRLGFDEDNREGAAAAVSRSSSNLEAELQQSDLDGAGTGAPGGKFDRYELIRPLLDAYGVIFFEMVRWVVIQNPFISHNIGILCDMIALMAEFMNQDRTLDLVLRRIISELEEAVGVKSLALLRDEVERLEQDDVVMQLCSRLLGKLNATRGFSRKLFEKIAQETVTSVTRSLIRICQVKEKREKNQTTPLLFLLKHLLHLRRIISNFDVSLVNTEIELDFSHISEGIMNFLRGKSTIQIRSIIFDILVHSHPKVLYKKISTKRNLDHEIATVCENLILNVTKTCFGGLMAAVHGDNKNPDAAGLFAAEIQPLEARLTELRAVMDEQLTEEDQTTTAVLVREISVGLAKVYGQYVAKMAELREEGQSAAPASAEEESTTIPPSEVIEALLSRCLDPRSAEKQQGGEAEVDPPASE